MPPSPTGKASSSAPPTYKAEAFIDVGLSIGRGSVKPAKRWCGLTKLFKTSSVNACDKANANVTTSPHKKTTTRQKRRMVVLLIKIFDQFNF
jgi:hypothetical protein